MQPLALSFRLAWLAVLGLLLPACLGQRIVHPVMPTGEELLEFEAAGPAPVEESADGLVALNVTGGPYRVVTGDLLAIELPRELTGSEAEDTDSVEVVRSRVDDAGTIRLPLVGEIEVGGKTLGEIEAALVALYHPAYIDQKPNVVVTVQDYSTETVAVMGSVASPGIHQLRSDRLTLLGALMAAGGINEEKGAGSIRIVSGDGSAEPVVLPVRNSTIPFSDVALRGGETVVVDPLPEQNFTCTGLVRRPGSFPYPHTQSYNLMQALAIAGGLDQFAAPRYASIYRKKADGEIVAATFRLDGTYLTDASNITVKPGDVVVVDHTLGSWLRQFLSQVLGFRASFSATSAGTL